MTGSDFLAEGFPSSRAESLASAWRRWAYAATVNEWWFDYMLPHWCYYISRVPVGTSCDYKLVDIEQATYIPCCSRTSHVQLSTTGTMSFDSHGSPADHWERHLGFQLQNCQDQEHKAQPELLQEDPHWCSNAPRDPWTIDEANQSTTKDGEEGRMIAMATWGTSIIGLGMAILDPWNYWTLDVLKTSMCKHPMIFSQSAKKVQYL